MSNRTTDKDVLWSLALLNKAIEKRNKQVKYSRRYGYKALDLHDLEGNMIKTIKTGMTSGEARKAIDLMIEGISLYC